MHTRSCVSLFLVEAAALKRIQQALISTFGRGQCLPARSGSLIGPESVLEGRGRPLLAPIKSGEGQRATALSSHGAEKLLASMVSRGVCDSWNEQSSSLSMQGRGITSDNTDTDI